VTLNNSPLNHLVIPSLSANNRQWLSFQEMLPFFGFPSFPTGKDFELPQEKQG
jgi:hypothetical protein